MADKTWKKNERGIAGRLNGRRVPVTGRQRGDVPDVAHDWLSIECKHRRVVPLWLREALSQARAAGVGQHKLPITILHESGKDHKTDLVLMTLADFCAWFLSGSDFPAKPIRTPALPMENAMAGNCGVPGRSPSKVE